MSDDENGLPPMWSSTEGTVKMRGQDWDRMVGTWIWMRKVVAAAEAVVEKANETVRGDIEKEVNALYEELHPWHPEEDFRI